MNTSFDESCLDHVGSQGRHTLLPHGLPSEAYQGLGTKPYVKVTMLLEARREVGNLPKRSTGEAHVRVVAPVCLR